ncbi:WXG100 family type VII secretion target [Amycolatopsis albispora]|uniref:PE domain-containing protein n=1 Tax=Amycolatopsis albispora TaxID=1804986 RepID=A0A344L7N7_9PSEU|nr:type VII secretion target [Amycolatopsis albispora]AXB44061.1 hypothetical protein A4R43_17280 [Amycolatopsis albispora]
MADIDVEPDVVRAAAPKFSAVSDGVTKAKNDLWAKGQGEGAPWGDDEAGEEFAKGYLPAVKLAETKFFQLAKAIEDTRKALDTAADRYEGTDQGVKRGLGKMGGQN